MISGEVRLIEESRSRMASLPDGVVLHISVITVALLLLCCVVPIIVTSLVVPALDYLLNDHLPNTMVATATSAAETLRTALFDANGNLFLRRGAMVAAVLSQRLNWTISAIELSRPSTLTAILAQFQSAADSSFLSRHTQVLQQTSVSISAMYGGNLSCIICLSVWSRLNTEIVNLTAPCFARWNNTLLQWEGAGVGEGTNYKKEYRVGNSTYPSTLNISLSGTAATRMVPPHGSMVFLSPSDGSLRFLAPVSFPAAALKSSQLMDGVYLDMYLQPGSSGVGLLQDPTMWDRIFQRSTTLVLTLNNSALQTSTLSTFALLHAPTNAIIVCADSGGAVTNNSISILDGVSPTFWRRPSPGCQATLSFLHSRSSTVSGKQGNVSQSAAGVNASQFLNDVIFQDDTDSYIISVPLSGATYALNDITNSGSQQAAVYDSDSARRAASEYALVVTIAHSATQASIIRTRGQIAVVAFAVAALTVFILLTAIRMMVQPLAAITRAVESCATLNLGRLEILEASVIVEVANIQRSLYYLAIRLHHYLQFLPDRGVLDKLGELDSNGGSDDDDDNIGSGSDTAAFSDEDSGLDSPDESLLKKKGSMSKRRATLDEAKASPLKPKAGSLLVDRGDDDDKKSQRRLLHQQRKNLYRGPQHSIIVEVTYESRHLNRNAMDRRKLPNKYAAFVFKYRHGDPVLEKLTKQVRDHLNELPGEILVLFAEQVSAAGRSNALAPPGGGGGGSDGSVLRQLSTDDDLFFMIEHLKETRKGTTAPTRSSYSSALADPEVMEAVGPDGRPLNVLRLTTRKGNVSSIVPLLIALGTALTAVSRIILSIQRLSSSSSNTQLLGLLILGCLAVQIAQNALISLYLVRRFNILDKEFHTWANVSKEAVLIGICFGTLNVTNLEVMSCHVRLSNSIRLNAPINARLRVKISKYSFVGFIVGDLLPFVFILINTVLTEQYRDIFVLLSTLLSVLSVASILVSHGILRFVIPEQFASSASGSGGTASGGTSGSVSSSGGGMSNRGLLLTKKEVSVVHISVSEEDGLLDSLVIPLIDALIEKYYEMIQLHVKQCGGLLLEASGLTAVVVFNAHTVVPEHPRVAFDFFVRLRDEMEKHVLPRFFGNERFRSHIIEQLPVGAKKKPNAITNAIYKTYGRHRVIGSIITDEMAIGYVGSLTAQSFQRVGHHAALAKGMCHLNELYGSTLLVNEACRNGIMQKSTLARHIDTIVLGPELVSYPTKSADLHYGVPSPSGAIDKAPGETTSPTPDDGAATTETAPWQPPQVQVFEIVVHAFSYVDPKATVVDSSGGGAPALSEVDRESMIANLLPHAHIRRRPKSNKTVETVKSFEEAFDMWRTVRNLNPMLKHLELYPEDVTAERVFHWAKFLWAKNKNDAIQLPRLMTSMGVYRHVCELAEGRHLIPIEANTEADRALEALQDRLKERNRLLRPPRSERRVREANRGGAYESPLTLGGSRGSLLGNDAHAVIEQVLQAPQGSSYSVRFSARDL